MATPNPENDTSEREHSGAPDAQVDQQEQYRLQRLQELAADGVDLSLVEASLRRTPTERVERMLSLLAIIEEGQRAYKVYLERQRQEREAQQADKDQRG